MHNFAERNGISKVLTSLLVCFDFGDENVSFVPFNYSTGKNSHSKVWIFNKTDLAVNS